MDLIRYYSVEYLHTAAIHGNVNFIREILDYLITLDDGTDQVYDGIRARSYVGGMVGVLIVKHLTESNFYFEELLDINEVVTIEELCEFLALRYPSKIGGQEEFTLEELRIEV